jgi:TrmH family RNA methyltransferase
MGRRSARRDERAFAVEGTVLVAEAARAGWRIEAQYVGPGVEPVADAGPVWPVAAGVIERASDTESPQGVIAVVSLAARHDESFFSSNLGAGVVVVCAGLADPGNLGTILRSAEAAGARAVVCTPGTVDPYSPKSVRASAGAIFHVPVLELDLAEVPLRRVGTSSHRGEPYTDADLAGPLAIVIGNEAHGLPPDAPIDEWVTIPHAGRTESLNAAMAATLLVFESVRQTRHNAPNA